MNITIVGCGNIGTQFAVHCAAKKHNVTVFCSKPDKIQKTMCIVDKNANIKLSGEIAVATDSAEKAFIDADLIFVTVPAFAMKKYADVMLPYLKNDAIICLIPGTGGSEFAFKKALEKGNIIFGLQRVPSVARLVEYGNTVCATGYRNQLFGASLPNQCGKHVAQIISDIFDIPCTVMPNYLNVTLTPSNPILHTARLRSLFANYKKGVFYDKVPLFYEDWDDKTSELLLKCDAEVQNICRYLKDYDLSYVKSLLVHYESENAKQLTQKIKSIPAFKGLKSPCIKTDNGYIPDFSSRYFTADFSYGLSILVQISKLLNLECPYMQETLDWYHTLVKPENEFSLNDYGIKEIEDLMNFYAT